MQAIDDTTSCVPWLPEIGDNSVHNGNNQSRAGTLYAQLAQQQLVAAAAQQQEMGGLVRGSNAAANALELAQVTHIPSALSVCLSVRSASAYVCSLAKVP